MSMAEQKKNSCLDLSSVPFDIITEILSWLPVESLLRFKCVRKQWSFLTDGGGNNYFIEKQSVRGSHSLLHYYQTKPHLDYLVPMSNEDFKYLAFSGGLCLEQRFDSPLVARVRNPATHQVFYLPEAHKDTIDFSFACNPLNGECKVVCVYSIYYDGYDEDDARGCGGVGYDILTVGKDEQWRHLKHPNQNKYLENGELCGVLFEDTCQSLGVCHAFVTVTHGVQKTLYVEMYHLDVLSESFTVNTLNRGIGISNLFQIRYFIWDNRPALAEITENNIIVFVLEDFKEHKWSQMKTIPLGFLKNDPTLKAEDGIFLICPEESRHNQLLFYKDEDGAFLLHDVEKNSTQLVELEQVAEERLSSLKSSLVNIEGMKPE